MLGEIISLEARKADQTGDSVALVQKQFTQSRAEVASVDFLAWTGGA